MKASRILVIEDDPIYRELITQILETANYEVFTAADGREGIKRYKCLDPDLVITDLIMPEMEGIETIRVLTKLNPDIKIIAVSGGGSMEPDDLLGYARNLGAGDCLAKPFSPSEVISKIEALLPGDREQWGGFTARSV